MNTQGLNVKIKKDIMQKTLCSFIISSLKLKEQHWIPELIRKIILAFGMACLTGIFAQIRIPLPWTPIPMTGQTFMVLLSGVLLKKNWGGISQTIYVIMGIAGVPWFTGFNHGYTAIMGPTGGYLIGFILAAYFIGHIADEILKEKNTLKIFAILLISNILLIHLPGLLQLWLSLHIFKGITLTLWKLLLMGTIPFIPGDIIKISVITIIAIKTTRINHHN